MSRKFLFKDISVDTVGDGVFGDGASVSLTCWGNFGGGAISFEISDDSGTTYVPYTENGTTILISVPENRVLHQIPATQLIRATLSGSGGASGVNVLITS